QQMPRAGTPSRFAPRAPFAYDTSCLRQRSCEVGGALSTMLSPLPLNRYGPGALEGFGGDTSGTDQRRSERPVPDGRATAGSGPAIAGRLLGWAGAYVERHRGIAGGFGAGGGRLADDEALRGRTAGVLDDYVVHLVVAQDGERAREVGADEIGEETG